MQTKRTIMEIVRHADPEVDPVSKRSLNVITPLGLIKSVTFGSEYSGFKGKISLYSTPEPRGLQTLAGINVGIGKQADIYEKNNFLDISFAKGKKLPKNISYGQEWIDYFLENNPGVSDIIHEEIGMAIQNMYMKGNPDLIIGVTHGPKAEIAAGRLLGIPEKNIGSLAASPLEGFTLNIDSYVRSGHIASVSLSFKKQPFVEINKDIFYS